MRGRLAKTASIAPIAIQAPPVLPQVAAISNYHFRVSKKIDAQETKSHIELLEKKDRVKEIARMLGGLDITSTTLEHAKEILG